MRQTTSRLHVLQGAQIFESRTLVSIMFRHRAPRRRHRVAHPTTHRTKASEIYWICQVLRSENMRDHDVEGKTREGIMRTRLLRDVRDIA